MKCPGCGAIEWQTLETRLEEEHDGYKRRKKCLACGPRVTTLDKIYEFPNARRTREPKPKIAKPKKPKAKEMIKKRVTAMMELERKRDSRSFDYWSPDNDFIPEKW